MNLRSDMKFKHSHIEWNVSAGTTELDTSRKFRSKLTHLKSVQYKKQIIPSNFKER